jgi:hypothetical protein
MNVQSKSPCFKELSRESATSLRAKTGFWDQLSANKEISKAAKEAQILAEKVKAEEEASISILATKLTGAAIRSSMAAKAMPTIGALTASLKAAVCSVDQSLTQGAAAEVYSHITNRNSSVKLFQGLANDGLLTKNELDVLLNFAQEDFEMDVMRSRQRTFDAKEAVDILHTCGISGIAKAKDIL